MVPVERGMMVCSHVYLVFVGLILLIGFDEKKQSNLRVREHDELQHSVSNCKEKVLSGTSGSKF